jgi:hypothetical protein
MSCISERSEKNMEKCVEQYQARGGGLTLPIRMDLQGWQEGNFSITVVPGTPVPRRFRKMLYSKKNLADMAPVRLPGEAVEQNV